MSKDIDFCGTRYTIGNPTRHETTPTGVRKVGDLRQADEEFYPTWEVVASVNPQHFGSSVDDVTWAELKASTYIDDDCGCECGGGCEREEF